MHNSAGERKTAIYSNGGELDLNTHRVTSNGGLIQRRADNLDMKANLLTEVTLNDMETGPVTETDPESNNLTDVRMLNWMECVRSRKQPNAPVEVGYNQSVATIMANAALRTKKMAVFDVSSQEVIVDGVPFKY